MLENAIPIARCVNDIVPLGFPPCSLILRRWGGRCLASCRWWTADLQNLRRAFREIDSDGSGFIDMFEFASLLRGWGIMFSPHQFQTAMKQFARNVEMRQQRWHHHSSDATSTPSSPSVAGGRELACCYSFLRCCAF